MKRNTFLSGIVTIVMCELIGLIGSVFTVSEIQNWYSGLVKPILNPPSWIFGPVWTALYALMGIAVYLVWKKRTARIKLKQPLSLFGVQLFLNAIWSIIFFGFHSPALALVDIVLLWCTIVWTIGSFYRVSKPAAYLLVPYILWVSFASYLNYAIWSLN